MKIVGERMSRASVPGAEMKRQAVGPRCRIRCRGPTRTPGADSGIRVGVWLQPSTVSCSSGSAQAGRTRTCVSHTVSDAAELPGRSEYDLEHGAPSRLHRPGSALTLKPRRPSQQPASACQERPANQRAATPSIIGHTPPPSQRGPRSVTAKDKALRLPGRSNGRHCRTICPLGAALTYPFRPGIRCEKNRLLSLGVPPLHRTQ
jgi:hypothetical protein